MPNLTLPPRSPTTLRAFWLVMSAACGIIVGAAASIVRRDARLLLLAGPAAACIAAPGLRDPQFVALPYRAWDRVGRLVTGGARTWVTTLGFGAMLATRSTGLIPPVPTRSPGESGWMPKVTQPSATYRYQDGAHSEHRGGDPFTRFAAQPGNGWSESLRPLVRLLGAMDTKGGDDAVPPSDIYTLY